MKTPNYADPAYRKSVEDAHKAGKRIQINALDNKNQSPDAPGWVNDPHANFNHWDIFNYRIHPDDMSTKQPNWHNPDNVPESELKPGERFLLVEEVCGRLLINKCCAWLFTLNGWSKNGENECVFNYSGGASSMTYKTREPLPKEYQEEEDVFSVEYQSKLAAEWVKGRFAREVWVDSEWEDVSCSNEWAPDYIYRRKVTQYPTLEHMDAEHFREYMKTHRSYSGIWKAALKYERNRTK